MSADMSNKETQAIEDAIKDAVRTSGKVNILIAGKTGVGKSTLINSIFRGELAKTGSGVPITQNIEEISKPGNPLSIIDSKGLELADYKKIIGDLQAHISSRNQSHTADNHVHIAWICIQEPGERVEQAEIDLCEMLHANGIPVIVVLTKSSFNPELKFPSQVRELLPKAKGVVQVRAKADDIYNAGTKVFTLPEQGINELILATGPLIPEAKQRSFANALDSKNGAAIKLKIEQAEKEVVAAAGLAAMAGATPIPFSDSFVLVPIQVGMLAKIGVTFGMEVSTAALTTLVASILGAGGAVLVGRALVTGILKMLPGIGSAAGGAIAAGTAAAITKGLGTAYISVLTDFCKANPGKELDIATIASELKRRYIPV